MLYLIPDSPILENVVIRVCASDDLVSESFVTDRKVGIVIMNAYTLGFSPKSAVHQQQVAYVTPGIRPNGVAGEVTALILGEAQKSGAQRQVLPLFLRNPPHVRAGVIDEIFIVHADSRRLLARPNRQSDSVLVLVRTKAGRFEKTNGRTQTLHGRVVKHAQGISRYEHVTHEECLVEVGLHAELQVTGTDGNQWVLINTGQGVKLMPFADYEKLIADELARDEPARELLAA